MPQLRPRATWHRHFAWCFSQNNRNRDLNHNSYVGGPTQAFRMKHPRKWNFITRATQGDTGFSSEASWKKCAPYHFLQQGWRGGREGVPSWFRAGGGFCVSGWPRIFDFRLADTHLTHGWHTPDTHSEHCFVMNEVFWRFGELSAIQAESATRDLQF